MVWKSSEKTSLKQTCKLNMVNKIDILPKQAMAAPPSQLDHGNRIKSYEKPTRKWADVTCVLTLMPSSFHLGLDILHTSVTWSPWKGINKVQCQTGPQAWERGRPSSISFQQSLAALVSHNVRGRQDHVSLPPTYWQKPWENVLRDSLWTASKLGYS